MQGKRQTESKYGQFILALDQINISAELLYNLFAAHESQPQ